jgi:predicted secreted protein
MAIQAGFSGTLEVSTDGSTYNTVSGANSVSVNTGRAMLDITDFDDDAVNRLAGLKDSSVSISGHYNAGDTGTDAIVAASNSGADIYIRWRPNGTLGWVVQGKVESFNPSSAVADTVTFDASIQAVTAWTVES